MSIAIAARMLEAQGASLPPSIEVRVPKGRYRSGGDCHA